MSEFNHTRVPRSLAANSPFPPQMIRKMRYVDPTQIQKNAAGSFIVREFRANDIFDPDPLLGGGSLSGYTELAALYSRNIVTHIQVSIDMINIEPGTVLSAYILFRDIQPSTVILTYNDAISSAEVAPCSKPVTMGPVTGQPRARIGPHKIPLATILGRPLEYLTDIGYAANVNSSPSQVLWVGLVIFSYTAATTIPNGLSAVITLDYTVNWFSGQKALDFRAPGYVARERLYEEQIQQALGQEKQQAEQDQTAMSQIIKILKDKI